MKSRPRRDDRFCYLFELPFVFLYPVKVRGLSRSDARAARGGGGCTLYPGPHLGRFGSARRWQGAPLSRSLPPACDAGACLQPDYFQSVVLQVHWCPAGCSPLQQIPTRPALQTCPDEAEQSTKINALFETIDSVV